MHGRWQQAGGGHSLMLKQDGSVWAVGRSNYGQLGDQTTTDKSRIVQVIFEPAKAVSAGRFHSLVLLQDTSVWVTGSNAYGQLGWGMSRLPTGSASCQWV